MGLPATLLLRSPRPEAGRGAAVLIHDAAVAFVALINAAVAWVMALAFTVIVIGWAGTLTGAWAVKTARSRLCASVSAEQPSEAPESIRTRKRRPVPSWAHTEPYDYDEAA